MTPKRFFFFFFFFFLNFFFFFLRNNEKKSYSKKKSSSQLFFPSESSRNLGDSFNEKPFFSLVGYSKLLFRGNHSPLLFFLKYLTRGRDFFRFFFPSV